MVSGAMPFFVAKVASAAPAVTVCAAGLPTCDYTNLQDAVTNVDAGGTISILGDLAVASQVTIAKSLTIDGNGYVLSPTFSLTSPSNNSTIGIIGTSNVVISNLTINGTAGTSLHGINVYESTGVSLNSLTITNNDKYAVVVNGSTVAIDSITTSGNGWGGINVDQGSGVTAPANLVMSGDNDQSETVVIYAEGSEPSVTVTDNTTTGQYTETALGVYLGPEAPIPTPACSATTGSAFDGFSIGSVNGQGSWSSTGSTDQAVVANDNAYGYSDNGCKSLRISNAVTSNGFADQTFSPSTMDEAGETAATNGGMSGGTRQNHYEAEFNIGTTQSTQQAGLSMSVSPDRGDGSRMSYLSFVDGVAGLDVTFYDVQGNGNPANFVSTVVASGLSRATPHTVKFVIDFVDGPSNDIVNIYIDGVLARTGTTWENYYRYDTEAAAEQTTRTVDSLIFRTSGAAVPSNLGKGFLIDGSVQPVVTYSTDTVAPAAPTAAVTSASTDTTPAFAGTAEANSTVSVTINGVTYLTLADAVGNWSLEATTPLAPGSYTATVTATDNDHNTSDPTVLPFTVTSQPAVVSTTNGTISPIARTTSTPNFASVFFSTPATESTQSNDDEDSEATLGAQTKKQTAKTSAVEATDSGWNIFGLAWYWWILILAALAGLVWFFVRRRNAEN